MFSELLESTLRPRKHLPAHASFPANMPTHRPHADSTAKHLDVVSFTLLPLAYYIATASRSGDTSPFLRRCERHTSAQYASSGSPSCLVTNPPGPLAFSLSPPVVRYVPASTCIPPNICVRSILSSPRQFRPAVLFPRRIRNRRFERPAEATIRADYIAQGARI
ncbi:hypothetical protein B0H17DRAFT_451184 [Mycena rosella]|uniref:Uncharacterized protein n=1 Tax=Mycena rosella TaxID=1033263 RepID=A0AAD7GYE3_MYCRO|nr:hypothetical protein B0H17DRAFT_451184 [Mycena rosella]